MPLPINVVLFGATHAGKSSVINLIAQKEVARVSSDIVGCTMEFTGYDVSFDNMDFTIFDTMGLDEPQMGVNGYLKAIERARELIVTLNAAGGIHLLLFCIRAGRITPIMQSNYRLFHECLCDKNVPIALVLTDLEREAEMENWWKRNEADITYYGMKCDGHACVTTVRDDTLRVGEEDPKYTESQKKIRELLKTCALKDHPPSWETFTVGNLMRSLIKKQRVPGRKNTMRVLTQRCRLDPDTARRMMEMMERDNVETENGNKDEQHDYEPDERGANKVGKEDPEGPGGSAKGGRKYGYLEGEGDDGPVGIWNSPKEPNGPAEPDSESNESNKEDGKSKPVYELEGPNGLATSDSVSSSPLHPTFRAPDFYIDDTVLCLWKQDQLTNVESILTTAINTSQSTNYHLSASRALIRTRLREWDKALIDAEKTIKNHPCAIAYIAKSIALVGKGQRPDGYRTCDIAFAPFHSAHVTFFLLIKAVIVFMAGEYLDAISRIDDLIATVPPNPIYHVVQAYMYLLWGNSHIESSNYEGAIGSFERARAQMQHDSSRALLLISLISGWKFDNLSTMVRQCLCEALYVAGRTEDAVKCFHDMESKMEPKTKVDDEHLEWAHKFKQGACKKLEQLGDAAVSVRRHDEAISHYTAALSLHLPSSRDILIKRGNAYVKTGCWEQALDDANQAIILDPSSPWGYEIKHGVLHKKGDYENAIHAFETMLSKIEQSPDPDIRQRRKQYKTPSRIRTRIRRIVKWTLRDSPHILINTTTGHLYNRAQRASTFESSPIFNELVSSMTTRIHRARIKQEVQQYFRYVMLSHKWEENEPLFEQVIHITVYDLEPSPTHDKLQMFCKIAWEAGFNWAWSDTCCIDTGKHDVHQEALVAMFKWYRGSALMIVFLRGVGSASRLGALARSIWNTRGWTLQEYIAAKVIHFYTEDWTPYLNLQLANHKESREVIAEMEQATGVSSDQLVALRPGLTSIREKLRLASTRQTERIEDAAYSLLGIFSVTGIPAIYGEGDAALGRLLSHVLTVSGDAGVLAWTGESGSFNSCLPARITVFNGPVTSHLPSPIRDGEMERAVSMSYTSSFDLDVALRLYDCLKELPPPWFAASRMRLPCISFQLPSLSSRRMRPGWVFRADTVPFGIVEIKTRQDLSQMKTLYLIHPWLDSLLGLVHAQSDAFAEDDVGPLLSPSADDEEISDDESDGGLDNESSLNAPELEPRSHPTPVPAVPVNRETRARRLAAQLRQPFGALLVAPVGRRGSDYRRVAADGLIRVAFQDSVSLDDILDNVRTLDVL